MPTFKKSIQKLISTVIIDTQLKSHCAYLNQDIQNLIEFGNNVIKLSKQCDDFATEKVNIRAREKIKIVILHNCNIVI